MLNLLIVRPAIPKILLLVSIVIAINGFTLHLSATAVIKENHFLISSGTEGIEPVPIQPDFMDNNYLVTLHVHVTGNLTTSTSFVLVNETEYTRFTEGTPLTSLIPLVALEVITSNNNDLTQSEALFSLAPTGPIYVIIENANPNVVGANIFVSAISPLYDLGIILAAIGTLGGLATLAWIYAGWKRYFCIGVGVNLALFFLSVAGQPAFAIPGDFRSGYVPWVEQILRGASLYSPLLEAYPNNTPPLGFSYPYPPLFVLTLAPFYFLPGPMWKMALPLVAANLATGYLVYKIVGKLAGDERRATMAMMIYFLNPFTLLFGSYMWWNPSLFVFFVVLAFYFTVQHKPGWAMVALGIAVMYKQLAIVFVPVLLISLAKEVPRAPLTRQLRNMLKPAAIFCATILAISLPFLIEDASAYINEVFLNQIGGDVSFDALINRLMTLGSVIGLVTLDAFFVWVGAPEPVTLTIAYLLQLYILLGACLILILVHLYRSPSPQRSVEPGMEQKLVQNDTQTLAKKSIAIECLFATLLLVFSLHVFFPRGSYKYYLMLLTPFIAVFYDPGSLSFRSPEELNFPIIDKKIPVHDWLFLLPVLLSWAILIMHRYIYFLFVLGWFLFYVILKRNQDRGVMVTLSRKTKRIALIAIGVTVAVIFLLAMIFPYEATQVIFVDYTQIWV